MDDLEELVSLLEKSVKKHGKGTVVTLGHLLNIFKKVRRDAQRHADEMEIFGSDDDLSGDR